MVTGKTNRTRAAIVLVTLALCALFTAQAATALVSSRVASLGPEPPKRPSRRLSGSPKARGRHDPKARGRHDPTVVLRRNIFDSALGDLSLTLTEEPEDVAMTELPTEEVEDECTSEMRLIGTVVLPGELEQSLAAIMGSDRKAGLHRGGAEVEGARIRSIQSDSVILQTSTGFCRLAMFEVDKPKPLKKRPVIALAEKADDKKKKKRRRPNVDRNAGLSDDELNQGIEKVNDTNYKVSRTMLNKVLDNAGKLIGIAAVAPKLDGGRSVGMEIRGIRQNTLLTRLGIQNGDILESVNGQSLTSTDAALGAYTTLRTAEKFNLSVRRGSESIVINYDLQ